MIRGQGRVVADESEDLVGRLTSWTARSNARCIGGAGRAADHDLHRTLQQLVRVDQRRKREEIARDLAGEGRDDGLGAIAIGGLAVR